MAVTAETRTGIIALSVAMLGEAPGTERLGDWVDSVDNGMTLEDLANHIASSDAFQATYPNFSTNQEFAEAFLGNLMGSEDVPAALVAAAVELVVGLLNDGMTRGALALAAVHAMLDINMQGEDHPAYGDLGMVAMSLANKIAVAEHYTLDARMMDPSSDVLGSVSSDEATVAAAISSIDNPTVDPTQGQNFVLTPTIDDIQGGDADDTIVAQPVAQVSNVFQDVLNPFDTIDGGGGTDTIHIFGVDPADTLSLGAEAVSNVENVVINTVGGITADLTDWDGVEMVNLRRFGDESDVTVIVDGASVSSGRTFGGKATIVGASGAVNIEAGSSSDVVIGSGAHTESVMVKGGASVTIGKNANGGGQSATVTSVDATGVKLNAGSETTEASGTFVPLTNTNGFVVGQDGSTQVGIDLTPTSGDDAVTPVGLAEDGVTLTNAIAGTPLVTTAAYSWDDDGDGGDSTATPAVPGTDDISVTAELKFDVNTGGLVFGKITSITGITAEADGSFVIDPGGTNERTIQPGDLDGTRVPASVAFTTQDIGKEDAAPNTVNVGAMPTLTINSDAIADVTLASTDAIVLVHNNSKTADGKNMPEDLSVTVNGYGSFNPNGSVKQEGKLCIAGAGSAETIMLDVAGASVFDLASNTVKTLNISGDARLVLDVNKFTAENPDTGPSETLASVMVSGAGGVTMNELDGMKKLASIDASGSSGKNSFKSEAELAALAMVEGGSGSDTVGLATSLRGKLASIDTGDGGDTVMIGGDYRDGGLMVDLGAGDDTFHGGPGNSESRIDGGDGRDTLRLSADGATYKDGDKTMSIYSNFEILDVGGGSGDYNVGRLGVDTIVAKKSTAGVTLNNVGGGTALNVSAEKAGTGTTAVVTYNFADDVNVAGSIIDGGTNNILNVSLMARGGSGDMKTGAKTGMADLTITLDNDLLAMTIDSDASVHGAAAGRGVTSGLYRNKVTVAGTASALEEVKITGNAMTELSGTGLTSLQYVNATESGAGVVVDASANTGDATSDGGAATRVRLAGSDHNDILTAGDFDGTAVTARNVLMGNGGDDMLTGGAGRDLLNGGAGADTLSGGDTTGSEVEDRFIYNAASDSQVTFSRNKDNPNVYDAKGYDMIMGFDSTSAAGSSDKIHLSKSLEAIFKAGSVKGVDEWAAGTGGTTVGDPAGTGWKPVDNDGLPGGASTATTRIDGDGKGRNDGNNAGTPDGGTANLFDFIGDGKGLFLTTVVGQPGDFGATTRTVKNSVALIEQDVGADDDATGAGEEGDGIWLLVDVDADGNFDASTDMVIFLAGVFGDAGFNAADDISS